MHKLHVKFNCARAPDAIIAGSIFIVIIHTNMLSKRLVVLIKKKRLVVQLVRITYSSTLGAGPIQTEKNSPGKSVGCLHHQPLALRLTASERRITMVRPPF